MSQKNRLLTIREVQEEMNRLFQIHSKGLKPKQKAELKMMIEVFIGVEMLDTKLN